MLLKTLFTNGIDRLAGRDRGVDGGRRAVMGRGVGHQAGCGFHRSPRQLHVDRRPAALHAWAIVDPRPHGHSAALSTPQPLNIIQQHQLPAMLCRRVGQRDLRRLAPAVRHQMPPPLEHPEPLLKNFGRRDTRGRREHTKNILRNAFLCRVTCGCIRILTSTTNKTAIPARFSSFSRGKLGTANSEQQKISHLYQSLTCSEFPPRFHGLSPSSSTTRPAAPQHLPSDRCAHARRQPIVKASLNPAVLLAFRGVSSALKPCLMPLSGPFKAWHYEQLTSAPERPARRPRCDAGTSASE